MTKNKAQTVFQSGRALIGVACLVLSLQLAAEQLSGRVVAVADGDTITVLDADMVQHKIRLAGIDAPEKAQAFGNRSKESLSELVFAKSVTVETSKKDRYGREIGKVLIDGLDANLEQVKRGMAWHYKQYQREQSQDDRQSYSAAENSARASSVGLWSDAEPMPPWDYRHKARVSNVECELQGCGR